MAFSDLEGYVGVTMAVHLKEYYKLPDDVTVLKLPELKPIHYVQTELGKFALEIKEFSQETLIDGRTAYRSSWAGYIDTLNTLYVWATDFWTFNK